ncbi:MAG: Nicotinate-nucleotide adenylyltransferase [Bacteroidota bacterium]|jgi:nicotinate-nucleotide adenylyltransferase
MKVGLFFGSFNPLHNGHLILAEGVLNASDLEQIWFVLTPQNPHKKKESMLADHERLNMLRDALYENGRFRASDIEFQLSPPYYTSRTLTHLRELHPEHEFSLVLGEDNLRGLSSWHNYEYILRHYRLLVYPRSSQMYEKEGKLPVILEARIERLDHLCVLPLSSSYIRTLLKQKKSIKYLVPESVEQTLQARGFYQ